MLIILQKAELDGPFSPHEWQLHLDGNFIADGKEYNFEYLDGDHSGTLFTGKFTEDQIKSGFTNTFTIEYTVEEGTDISLGNFKDAPVTEMNYLTTEMDDFQKNITTSNASDILKNLGFNVKSEWLKFEWAFCLDNNQQVDEDFLKGTKYGAGLYHIEILVTTNELGKENNFVGSMTFFMKLRFKYGDLGISNNQKFERVV